MKSTPLNNAKFAHYLSSMATHLMAVPNQPGQISNKSFARQTNYPNFPGVDQHECSEIHRVTNWKGNRQRYENERFCPYLNISVWYNIQTKRKLLPSFRMQKQHQPSQKNKGIRTSQTGKCFPTFTIPRYSERFKDVIAKAQLNLKSPPPTIETYISSPPKQKQSFFFFRVKSIGVGAHSFVSLVQQQQSKMLLSEKSITKQHARQIQQDLTREIKLLSFLEHNNIIKLYHFYDTETHINLVTEYAEDSLFCLKQKFGTFKEKQIIQVMRQLLLALQYLHRKGIVHADIKLENIMISNGTIKLIDFGLAHRIKEKQHKKQVDGTMEYLPPEYAQGNDSGTHRDIWAIGIMVYQMAVGKNPFDDMKQNQKWTKLVKNPPDIYTNQLEDQLKLKGMQCQKVIELVKGIFQPHQKRWTADQLLQLPFFAQQPQPPPPTE